LKESYAGSMLCVRVHQIECSSEILKTIVLKGV
jgi:hypothetical protein